jgi:ABC-type taurine transport system substrate-binding protein
MNAKKLRGIIISARKIAEQYRMDGAGVDHIVACTGVKREKVLDLLIGDIFNRLEPDENLLYKHILSTGVKKDIDKASRTVTRFGKTTKLFCY